MGVQRLAHARGRRRGLLRPARWAGRGSEILRAGSQHHRQPSGFTKGGKEGLAGIFKRRRELAYGPAFSACPAGPGSPMATELVPKSPGSVWSLEDREEEVRARCFLGG